MFPTLSGFTSSVDGSASYSYNTTNEVTAASYTGTNQPANESNSFDANGNRTNTGYSTGTNNQLTSDGTFNYTYDHEGNRVSRTRISSATASDYITDYSYDYRNRLTDVNYYNNSSVLTKHIHYVYDVYDHLIGTEIDATGSGSYSSSEWYALDLDRKRGRNWDATRFLDDGDASLLDRSTKRLAAPFSPPFFSPGDSRRGRLHDP